MLSAEPYLPVQVPATVRADPNNFFAPPDASAQDYEALGQPGQDGSNVIPRRARPDLAGLGPRKDRDSHETV